MKSKLVLCMLILSNVVFSIKCQEINYENFYKNLDSTRITTGLLYNKIVPYTQIQDFTGESDTVVTNSDNWLQLYFELFNSHIIVPETPNISNLCDSIGKDNVNFRVPIGIINMNYNLIKDNALDDSLLVIIDSLLYDGPNTSESPYTTNRCFAASALINNCPTSYITFFLSDDFLFENTGEDILYYQIDFDDGNSPVTMYNNDEYTLIYSQAGNKNIAIKAILSNGDTLRCKSTFLVNDISQMLLRSLNENDFIPLEPENRLDTSEVIGHFTINNNSYPYYGTYGIWYGCNSNHKITKPVIFVEGYDYDESNEFSNGRLFGIAKQADLLKTLINQGCDVIILNFHHGHVPIEANGMVLRALIDKINHLKVTNNELVIVGASMGGLVTRYALSYMEQQQEDHQTRLFISLDSPNQGAYGSLAGQHLLTEINKVNNTVLSAFCYKTARDIWNMVDFMDSYAGTQMLVYHHSAQDNKIAKQHPYRTAFLETMAAFPNNGYPQLCRKVAISCGDGIGHGQGYEAGTEQLNWDVSLSNLYMQLKLNALPDHTDSKIMDLNAGIKIPWKFLWKKGIITVPIINIKKYVNNTDPYDNSPGGRYGLIKGLGDALKDKNGPSPAYPYDECFIPTVSALDIDKSHLQQWNTTENHLFFPLLNNSHLTFIDSCCEISDHTITPFDAIYVGNSNLSHITQGGINRSIANWIDKEINRETITINNKVYDNEAKQYEAKNTIIASSTNNQVVIEANSDIIYLAGESIVLNPGFIVNSGASFSAIIHKYECSLGYQNLNSSYTLAPRSFLLQKTDPIAPIIKINIQDNKGLSIAPNPFKDYLELKTNWNSNVSGSVSIYNSLGKLVFKDRMVGSTKTIQLNQPSGVYLLKATCGDNLVTNRFIIKK